MLSADRVLVGWGVASHTIEFASDGTPCSTSSRPDRDTTSYDPLGIVQHRGFETVIPLHARHRYASVTALNAFGRPLRRSPIIEL